MKKLLLYLPILCTLISCSTSDNDETSVKTDLILGKWFYSSQEYNGEETILTDCQRQQSYEFFSNGTISIRFEDNGVCNYSVLTGEYAIANGVLEITNLQGSDDLNYSFDIISLSKNSLIIQDELQDPVQTYRLELIKE